MKQTLLNLFLPVLLLIPAGCTFQSLNADLVQADEETYSVVAPQVQKWLTKEPGLTLSDEEAVRDWEVKLRSWKDRIDNAKRVLAEQEQE